MEQFLIFTGRNLKLYFRDRVAVFFHTDRPQPGLSGRTVSVGNNVVDQTICLCRYAPQGRPVIPSGFPAGAAESQTAAPALRRKIPWQAGPPCEPCSRLPSGAPPAPAR